MKTHFSALKWDIYLSPVLVPLIMCYFTTLYAHPTSGVSDCLKTTAILVLLKIEGCVIHPCPPSIALIKRTVTIWRKKKQTTFEIWKFGCCCNLVSERYGHIVLFQLPLRGLFARTSHATPPTQIFCFPCYFLMDCIFFDGHPTFCG